MKYIKCMVIVLTLLAVTGIGLYMCNASKETEQIEEAVMI